MRSILLYSIVVASCVLAACDKKQNESAPTPTAPSSSAKPSTVASAPPAPSPAASFAGACAALAKAKTEHCNKLSAGDPTAKAACEELVQSSVAAGDDAKCHLVANPPPAPSGELKL